MARADQLIADYRPTAPLPFWKRMFQRKEPGLHDLPSMEGSPLGLSFIVRVHSGWFQPTHEPSKGDVVIQLMSDSMGMSVRRDCRWRVLERVTEMVLWGGTGDRRPYSAVRIQDESGTVRNVLCSNCWPCTEAKLTWVWVD